MSNSKKNYWYNYGKFIGEDVIKFVETKLEEEWIASAGAEIHLDMFIKDKKAPTIVFSHGMAGYGRLLAPYAYHLYNNGFNVILPDLIGYGHNKGKRGHWRWEQLVQNLIDTCTYAKENFNDNVFLAGASMGGALAYHAVCHGAPVKAVTSYCLYDYHDMEFMRESSGHGAFADTMHKSLNIFAKILPTFNLPASMVASYDNLSDSKEFNNLIKNDPLAGNKITLQAVNEMVQVKLPITFEEYNKTPILVIQPGADKMTPARFIKKCFDRLGIAEKRYVEVEGRGHWVIDREGVSLICNEMTEWFQRYSSWNNKDAINT